MEVINQDEFHEEQCRFLGKIPSRISLVTIYSLNV